MILAHTFSTVHGPTVAPYEIDLAGDRSRVQAGAVVRLTTEPIRNPVTQAESHLRAILPQGFVTKDAALLASSVFQVEGEVRYDHSGQYAAVGASTTARPDAPRRTGQPRDPP